jgi:hypothetical protein
MMVIRTATMVSVFLLSWNNEKPPDKKKADSKTQVVSAVIFDKLTGTWKSANGKSFERWTKKEDGTFQSVTFRVKGTDTSWIENARIYPHRDDKWVFENTVKGQNDGKSVKFVSSWLNENSVQFSNPAHDFPTDINYTVIDPNTVHAFIIGPNNKGGKDTIHFSYTRVK